MPCPVNGGREMPCSLAASAIALDQALRRGFSVIILFIRRVFGELHVFHRSLDQILVFISSAVKHPFSIERPNAQARKILIWPLSPSSSLQALAAASVIERSVDQLV